MAMRPSLRGNPITALSWIPIFDCFDGKNSITRRRGHYRRVVGIRSKLPPGRTLVGLDF